MQQSFHMQAGHQCSGNKFSRLTRLARFSYIWRRNVETEFRAPQFLWYSKHPETGIAVLGTLHREHAGERALQYSRSPLRGPGSRKPRHRGHHAVLPHHAVHHGDVDDDWRGRQHAVRHPPRAKEVHPGEHHSKQLVLAPVADGRHHVHARRDIHGTPAPPVRSKRPDAPRCQQLHAHIALRCGIPDGRPGHEPLYP